jgi:glycosyltransferase involved in cell wall biosynthesis
MRLKILHIVAHSFLPPVDGGRIKSASLATALASLGELHVLSLDDDLRRAQPALADQELDLPWGGACTWHSAREVPCKRLLARSATGWLRAARAGVFLPPAWIPFTPRHGELLARIRDIAPDLVLADETLLAPLAAFAPAKLRLVHAHNVDSRLLGQGAQGGHRSRVSRRLGHIETTLFPRMDQVWGVKAEDLDAFHACGVARDRLHLAPNVIPPPAFEPDPRPGPTDRAVYFGSLWYPPNQRALAWLLEAWPALRNRRPQARLAVAGTGAPADLEARARATEGVEFLGFVPDLQALLREASLVAIPLLDGGGTKIKTLEAMASARPILASPVAVEGLSLEDGRHALVREPGPDFLEALETMLADPARFTPLGLEAQALAARSFSIQSLREAVGRALGSLPGLGERVEA